MTLVVLLCLAGWLGLAARSAWADQTIDNTGCATSGWNLALTDYFPPMGVGSWQAGTEFTAPADGILHTFAPVLSADGAEPAELVLYGADQNGPTGSPVWSTGVTIGSTGGTNNFSPRTFIVDQPVIAGDTYFIGLVPGSATANTRWALSSNNSPACNPCSSFGGMAGGSWGATVSGLEFAADFTAAPPSASITAPSGGGTYALNQTVTTSFSCAGGVGSTLASCTDSNGTDGTQGTLDTSTVGQHTYTVTATDADAQTAATSISYTVAPPPTATVNSPSTGGRYALGQAVPTRFSCSAAPGGAAIVSCLDSNSDADGTGGLDTSASGQHTYTVTATDANGFARTASLTYTIDGSAPTIQITTPENGATYKQGAVLKASFTCTDPDGSADVATCTAPVTNGNQISTAVSGQHTFTVSATDKAGNTTSETVTYTVATSPVAPPASPAINLVGSGHLTSGGVVDPSVKVTCPPGTRCTATVTATIKVAGKTIVVGRGTVTVAPRSHHKLTFKLTARGAQLLARVGLLHATVSISARATHGPALVASKKIVLYAPTRDADGDGDTD